MGGRIALIVAAVLAVLLAAALLFVGNYLFRFALDPQFGGMIDGSQEWPLEGDSAWLDENSEDRWLESRDGLKLHALYLAQPEQSHKYVVACHGYGSIPQYMGRSAAQFYEMGFNILAPAARAHECFLGDSRRWARSPSSVRRSRPVVSLSSRPTGNSPRRRSSSGSRSSTVGWFLSSVADSSPAGLWSMT